VETECARDLFPALLWLMWVRILVVFSETAKFYEAASIWEGGKFMVDLTMVVSVGTLRSFSTPKH
jgi:hypothetical protein